MAFAEVFVNNGGTTASDLYNSGCPRVAVVNSATAPASYQKAAIVSGVAAVTITCADNAAAVALKALIDAAIATTPRMLLFVNDATVSTRNFAWFAAADYAVVGATVVFTLTGAQTFGTTASGLDWGIGGERATIGSSSSVRLLVVGAGKGDLCKPNQVNGESVRVVICGSGQEVIPELRFNLPGIWNAGAGGTQFQLASEAYASTPDPNSRPTLAFTGVLATSILYEGADLEFDNGVIVGFDIRRLAGTAGGTLGYAIRFYSHVRIEDCRCYCDAGANVTNWVLTRIGTGQRGAAVIGCTFVGHTALGVVYQGQNGARLTDNTVVGGTDAFWISGATTNEVLFTGNRAANCSGRGLLWEPALNGAGRGTMAPLEFSHNTFFGCGTGALISPSNATQIDGPLSFGMFRNNNAENCTIGFSSNGTTNPSAAILEGLGLQVVGNNTGAGSSQCGTRYGGNLSVIAHGEKSTNTGMSVSVNGPVVTFNQSSPLGSAGMGGTSVGAGGGVEALSLRQRCV